MKIDLTELPSGDTYEDRYGGYLHVFEQVATTPPDVPVLVVNAPSSWIPLLCYLGAECHGSQNFFEHDVYVHRVLACSSNGIVGNAQRFRQDRTLVEVLCGFRPECVDALWKVDREWATPFGRGDYRQSREFIVTTNAAFSRKEVQTYLARLRTFVPPKGKTACVIVPCAADKPYPSPLHTAVKNLFPSKSWYLAIATGVLGIVPEMLWDEMPYYDSGIPNRWRVFQETLTYFSRTNHAGVMVYSDFYCGAISLGLQRAGTYHVPLFPAYVEDVPGYEPLLSEGNLERLRDAMARFEGEVELSGEL
jgi:hypothetical protein